MHLPLFVGVLCRSLFWYLLLCVLSIDIQKALKRDYIYNMENTDLDVYNILMYVDIPDRLANFFALRINLLKYNGPKVITQSLWYIYSFAIILTRKRDLIAFLLFSFRCLVTVNVLWLFLKVPLVGLQCAIVVFPDHTHLLF